MALKILTPDEMWRGFKEDGSFAVIDEKVSVKADFITEHTLTFVSETVDDGDITVSVRFLAPESYKAVAVVVEDYKKSTDEEFIKELLKSGLAVAIPDYSDRYKSGTSFTALTAYLAEDARGDRLYEVNESAKDSCQFVYSKMVRNCVTLIKNRFGADKFLFVSVGDSAEVAVTCAATDSRAVGLLMLNGFGYYEFNDLNVFGETKEAVYDEKLLSWMSGVSAVAYTQYVRCPVLIAVGTNSNRCDMDRLSGFTSRMNDATVSVVLSAGAKKTVGYDGFRTVKNWISRILSGLTLPRIPDSRLFVSRDGTVYTEVTVDTSAIIEKVEVYYSTGEYNRRFRGWRKAECMSIADGEYMATVPLSCETDPVFSYAQVTYIDGTTLSSYVSHIEAKEQKVKLTAVPSRHIVVESGRSFDCFAIDRTADIVVSEEKIATSSSVGLKGVKANKGGLLTFVIAEAAKTADSDMLQIDIFSEKGVNVGIELESLEDGVVETYTASYQVLGSSLCFSPVRLTAVDFKNADLKPLEGWNNVKSLKVLTPSVAVGNIIFV